MPRSRSRFGGDRISGLHDSIACHILSFLPTREAVATSLLSTRWRHLWTSITKLDIDGSSLLNHNKPRGAERCFVNFTNHLLLLRGASPIKELRLQCLGIRDHVLIGTWIRVAMGHNVIKLIVEVPTTRLPAALFTSNSLVELSLKTRVINVPASVWLPSLQNLSLEGGEYPDDGSMLKLFTGCPSLQELELLMWLSQKQLVINVSHCTLPSLKVLKYKARSFPTILPNHKYIYTLLLSTPSLKFVDINDDGRTLVKALDLPSLVDANIDMISCCLSETKEKPDYCNQVIELLKEMTSIKGLSLTRRTLWCIWDADNQILPIFHQLTCLQLNVEDDLIWNLLSRFLESSPKLESLVMICEGYTCFDKNTEWAKPSSTPDCLLFHLRKIKIRNFDVEDFKAEVLEYLVVNSKVLQRVSIHCRDVFSKRSQKFTELWKRLNSLKVSRTCIMEKFL